MLSAKSGRKIVSQEEILYLLGFGQFRPVRSMKLRDLLLVSTHTLADRHNDAKGSEPTDLVYFGMRDKGIYVVRYPFFSSTSRIQQSKRKRLIVVT